MGMDIRLARIDDRLIHGQVATAWSKMTVSIESSWSVMRSQMTNYGSFLERSCSTRNQINVVTVAKCLRWRITHYLIRKSHVIIYQPSRCRDSGQRRH